MEEIRGTQDTALSLLFLICSVHILLNLFILRAIDENFLPNLIDTWIKILLENSEVAEVNS